MNQGKRLSTEEYINSLDCDGTKRVFSEWFSSIPKMVRNINKMYNKNMDIPNVFIKIEDTPNASTLFGSITITTAMMDFIKKIESTNLSLLFPSTTLPDAFCDRIIIDSSFYWFMYHELFHLAFEHAELIDKQDDRRLASLACEYDADLCSIAMVYRQLEAGVGKILNLNKPQLCQVVMYGVYWFIRTIQDLGKETDHPSIERRLCFLIDKIARLNISGTEADYSLVEEDSRKAINDMVVLIRAIEEKVVSPGLISKAKGDALEAILKVTIEQRKGCETTKEWLRLFSDSETKYRKK